MWLIDPMQCRARRDQASKPSRRHLAEQRFFSYPRRVRRYLQSKWRRAAQRLRAQAKPTWMEQLEPRTLLSSFTVDSLADTTADDGVTTLREAIIMSEASAGADVIEFDAALEGSIDLDSVLPDITDTLTINGDDRITIDGQNNDQLFSLTTGANLTLDELVLTNGYTGGNGGVVNYGNGAALTINNSRIENNTAAGFGGAIALTIGGNLTIENSTFSNNSTETSSGGAIFARNADIDITGSTFASNEAGSQGGSFHGGAIYNAGSTITITDSLFEENTAAFAGGAIYNTNQAGDPISIGTITITNTAIIDNSTYTSAGGGIFNAGNITVINSTISGNQSNVGAGITNQSVGGSSPTADISNSTIAFNTTTVTSTGAGSGLRNVGGQFTLTSTIVANNTDGNGDASDIANLNAGTTTGSFNLISDAATAGGLTDGTDGNIVGEDPQLFPLRNYGGDTFTHAIGPDSPAIDQGDANDATTDQRGALRTFDVTTVADQQTSPADPTDIGAYEYQTGDPDVVPVLADPFITGLVFRDVNGDGVRDPGDQGLGEILVDLYDEFDSYITSVFTDPDGSFRFIADPGDYTVRVDENYIPGLIASSNVNEREVTHGGGISPVDPFGFTLLGGTIGGIKFDDIDADGRWDVGERTIADVTFFLDLNFNNVLDEGEPTATTDGSGRYEFQNVPFTTAVVRELTVEGQTQTSPTATTFLHGDFVTNPDAQVQDLVAEDFNGDGLLDLVILTETQAILRLQNEEGFLGLPSTISLGDEFLTYGDTDILVGHFNDDAAIDLMIPTDGHWIFLLNNGVGFFTQHDMEDVPFGDVEALDLTGDGLTDLMVFDELEQRFEMYKNLGGPDAEGFAAGTFVTAVIDGSTEDTEFGDFNNDGNIDMAVLFTSFTTGDFHLIALLNDGTGQLIAGPEAQLSIDVIDADLAIGDVTGDGNGDIVVLQNNVDLGNDQFGSRLTTFALADASTFATPIDSATLFSTTSIELFDANGDGHLDALISGQAVFALIGDGSGSFLGTNPIFLSDPIPAESFYFGDDTFFSVATGDFNNDGRDDAFGVHYDSYGFPNSYAIDLFVNITGGHRLELIGSEFITPPGDINFGNVPEGNLITGRKFLDENGNGIDDILFFTNLRDISNIGRNDFSTGNAQANLFDYDSPLFPSLPGPVAAAGTTIGPDGNVYVADNNTGSIYAFSPDGQFVRTLVDGASQDAPFDPGAIAFSPDGTLFVVSDSTDILRYDFQTGEAIGKFNVGDDANFYSDLEFSANGNLYAADAGATRIVEFAPDGQILRTLENSDLNFPQGIAIDGNRLIATDNTNDGSGIVIFDLVTGDSADEITIFFGEFDYPELMDIDLGPDGFYYVVDQTFDGIRRINATTLQADEEFFAPLNRTDTGDDTFLFSPQFLAIRSEPGVADVIIYSDTNDNGQLDLTFHEFDAEPDLDIGAGLTKTSDIVVSGIAGETVNFLEVGIELSSDDSADLEVTLIAPNGDRVTLVRNATFSGGFLGTLFADDGNQTLFAAEQNDQSSNGLFIPRQSLASLNGIDPNGTWSLEIINTNTGASVANLEEWFIEIGVGDPLAQTDANGNYRLAGLPDGEHTLREVTPINTVQTSSDANPLAHTVTLADGETLLQNVDFANAPHGEIHGFYFRDVDGNGTYSELAGDVPLADIIVFLDANDNGLLDQETFDAIEFVPVIPDTISPFDERDYSGVVTGATEPVSGVTLDLVFTEPFSPESVFITLYSGSGAEIELELTGDSEIHIDTGAFNGQNANGQWFVEIENEDDTSIAIVSVNLTIVTGEQSAETMDGDAAGEYWFTNVLPGTHIVRSAETGVDISFPPATRTDGFESQTLAPWNTLGNVRITDDSTAPPADGDIHALLTNSLGAAPIDAIETFAGLTSGALDSLGGVENPTEGSVIQRTIRAEIGDVVSFDFNFLTNETEQGDIANDFAFAVISDGSGPMLLADADDEPPASDTSFNAETGYGTFQHTFTSAGLFTITIGVVDVDDNAVDSALLIDNFTVTGTGMESLHVVDVEPGETIEDIDFASLSANAIGNRVWHDVNVDGIRQLEEEGIDGVTINLYLVDGGATLVDTTTTSGGGFYSFDGFADGDYFVEVVLPDDFDLFTTQHVGDIANDDNSNIDAETGFSNTIKFSGGETRNDIDAGLIQFGTISGAVFNDANHDGQRDGEPGINGWTVQLIDTSTEEVVATQTSATITGLAPIDSLIVGSDAGQTGQVLGFDPEASALDLNITPDSGFAGGVRVATGDINGDGLADIITSPGAGTAPTIRVFSGADQSLLTEFFAYDETFTGGVFVAAGDVNGDGIDDIITGAGSGGTPQVKVFDGSDPTQLLADFFAYDEAFTGGVRVASGDVNGDGHDDIITGAGAGGTPNVKVFDGDNTSQELASFFAYDEAFTGGVFVASGDVNGDGHDDIITGADAGGTPSVKVFDGDNTSQELASFFAYDEAFTGGVRVASGDVNGDGHADIITGVGAGGTPRVKVFDVENTSTPLADFVAYDEAFTGGVFVTGVNPQAEDADGRYFFTDVAPGSYAVRQVVENEWEQTAPADNGSHDNVLINSGANVVGLDFGNFNVPTGDVTFTLPEAGSFELFIADGNVVIQNQSTDEIFFDAPLENITNLTINGTAGADTLIIDMSAGNPLPTTFTFNGNDPTTGTGDTLELRGGTADVVNHTISAIDSGGITIVDGSSATTITYTGLEPVIDTIVATHRNFTFTGADETITITESLIANATLINSTLGESIEFINPTSSLTIDVTAGTGEDTIHFQGVGSNLSADLLVTGDDDDEIIFDTVSTTLDGGDLTLSVGTIGVGSLDLGVLAIGEDEPTIDLGDGNLIINTTGTSTIDGDIASGNVTINGGSLAINGNITTTGNSTVINAPITGDGAFFGTVLFAGTLAPGDAPRIFTANTFNFLDGSVFDVAVAGLGTGQQDQLKVIGGVSIATGSTLTLESFQGFSPETPGEFTIIDNQSETAVTGEFDGFAEGEVFDSDFLGSGLAASISYTGGDGNDVVITVAPVQGIISGTKYRDDNADGSAFDDLIVTDSSRGVFEYFDSSGSGAALASISHNVSTGVTIGPDGKLYVAADASSRVDRFDAETGAYLDTFIPTASIPGSTAGITFGPDGNLYVADDANNQVLRFDGATGTLIDVFVTPGDGGLVTPYEVEFGPDGNLYVSSQGGDAGVRRYDPTTGAFIDVVIQIAGATGIDFADNGNLFVASATGDTITEVTLAGNVVNTLTLPPNFAPRDIDFGSGGNLYAAGKIGGNSAVGVFDPTDGTLLNNTSAVTGATFNSIAFLSEPGIQGVRIYVDLNNNGVFDDDGEDVEPSDITDENGDWLIGGLQPGDYTVREVVADGFLQTSPALLAGLIGYYDFEDGDADNAVAGPNALSDLIASGVTFANGDAQMDFTSYLELPEQLGSESFTIYIDATYQTSAAGHYIVSQRNAEIPTTDRDFQLFLSGTGNSSFSFYDAGGGQSFAAGPAVDGEQHQYGVTWDLAAGQAGYFVDEGPATIGSALNSGNLPDIENDSVLRFGKAVATVNGRAGNIHRIMIFDQTLSDTELEALADYTPGSHSVTVTSGAVIENIDFFNVSTTQSLAGTKYLDLDGDGNQDEGDSPIEGVTVFLDLNDNGEFDEGDEPFDVTDEFGDWLIDGILPGTYTVREVVPEGFTQTGAPASVQVDAFDNLEDLDFFNEPDGTTAVRLDLSGNLLIQDIGSVTDDTLTIQSDAQNSQYIISDASNLLFTDIAGATGNGTNTVTVAFTSVTGSNIIVDTLGGDDTLTLDFSLGDLPRDVQFNGGSQTTSDALELVGGSFDFVDFVFSNANDGSIDLDESASITYTGLEPITSSMDINNLTLIYNGGSETIAINDAGRTGETTVTSTAGESVTFANPTTSLFISAGSGDDTITVNSLGSGFGADLGISGNASSADVINWNATDGVGNLLLEAESIHLNADITATGNQTYTGTAILDTDVTLTATEVVFDNTIDSATGETNTLAINGDAEFNGIVGGADALASLSINATGGDVFFRAAVNVGVGGLTVDPADFIQVDGVITSLGAVSLEAVGSGPEGTILVNNAITATDVTITAPIIEGSGNITTTVGDVTIDGSGELSGAIIAAGTLIKQGDGTFTLAGSATSATVAAGRLDVTGNITGTVTVDDDTTLGGDGSIAGAVHISGSLAPGQSPGTLATGDVTFADNASFNVEFDLPHYDQLDVTGNVTIGNNVALNAASFDDYTPTVGDTFIIIDNDSADAAVGTFAGLAEGAELTNFLGSALSVTISYVGGDGNDVVITVLPLATISGRVWHDQNADGLFIDESIITAHTVQLVRDDNIIDTVSTDSNGEYTFHLAEAGTYFVQVSPGTFDENSPLPDSPNAPIDTDINPITQRSEAITVTGGEDFENIDAGLFDFATVDGFKFLDINDDGIQQEGDTGIGGFTFYVDYNDNGTFDEGDEPFAVSSDGLDEQAVGEFTIFGIKPGTYKVREVPRAGFEQTAPADLFYTIDVASGDTFGDVLTFGNFSLATDITLTGYKFVDTNANGTFDNGETPLDGVRIYVDLDNNGTYDDGEPFAFTDETGQFTIEQVPAGSWQVREAFDTEDIANYLPTTPLQYVGSGNLTIEQVLDQGDDASDAGREVDGLLGAFDVTVSPDGRFIYTAGKDPFGATYDPELALSGAIGIFSRNPVDGSIESIGSFTQDDAARLASVSGLAVSPDGDYLYAVADVGEAILVFERDQVSGQLTLIQTRHDGDAAGTSGLSGARRVAVSADGKSIYVVSVADNQVTHFRRNANGTLTAAGSGSLGNLVGATVLGQDVAVSSDGRSVYVVGTEDQGNDFIIAFSRNTTTGALTFAQTITNDQLGGAAGLGGAVDVEIARDGRHVFVAGRQDNAVAVFERDATDSTLTLLQTVTANIDGPSSIAASNDGTQVFVANFSGDSISVFDRNPLTGRLDAHSQTASGDLNGAFALALDPIGNDLFAVGFVSDTLVSLSRDVSGFIPGGFEFSATINETIDGFIFGNFTGGDLVASINDETFAPPATIAPGAAFNLPFDITNVGPAAANGTVDVNIYASTDDSLNGDDILIHRLTDIDINLLPDQMLSLNPQVKMTGEMLGNDTYRFIVDINPSHALPEMDFTNNTDVSAGSIDVNLAIAGLGNSMQLVNAFGDVFRVALVGTTAGATSAITLTAALQTDSFGNPIYDLTIAGGNAQSQVVITNLSGNDRRLDLGDVTITGQFANFTAAKTNLFGDFSADNIRNITMGDWDANHVVRIHNNNGGQLVNIDIDRWVDVDFVSAAAIGSFNATFMYDSSDDDRFFAPSVNSLFVEGGEDQAGDSNVYFDIAGHLGSAVINGAVSNEWNVGSAGDIIAGNANDFALYVVNNLASLTLAHVTYGRVDIGGDAGTIFAQSVTDGQIIANSVNSIEIIGDWINTENLDDESAEIGPLDDLNDLQLAQLIAGQTNGVGKSASAIVVGGVTNGITIRAEGDINVLHFGRLRDSTVFAGVRNDFDRTMTLDRSYLPDSTSDFARQATIGQFTVTGLSGSVDGDGIHQSFVDSIIASWNIGNAAIREVNSSHYYTGDKQGIAGVNIGRFERFMGSLGRVTIYGGEGDLPDKYGNFHLRVIEPDV